ncbi:MAG: CDP-alcohol phosphatidyltransferase family protein [Pseudomonadota bacterium]
MLRWLPNIISYTRIALVPLVFGALLDARFGLALMLFVAAGFSDGLDGFLARRFRWHTELGAILDPIADKLLLIATFAALASVGVVPMWFGMIVIARDLIIMGGAITYHFVVGDLEGKPTLVSKLNTMLLLLYVLVVLINAAGLLPAAVPGELLTDGLQAVLLVSLTVSTIDYVRTALRGARLTGSQV